EVDCQRLAPRPRNPSTLAQAALCRHTPEVGAVCGKAARTVLCGGRSAMSVPTATVGTAFLRGTTSRTPGPPPSFSIKLRSVVVGTAHDRLILWQCSAFAFAHPTSARPRRHGV